MLIHRNSNLDDEQWAPVSDLMAVVMLIFMLITMILFVNFDLEKQSNKERCDETKSLLDAEFHNDFLTWGAMLEKDLTIRFTNQSVNFEAGLSNITEEGGAAIIKNFFPRYMDIIEQIRKKFGDEEVLAIRIEGHTSSEYENSNNPYIANLELSQDRARNIVDYALSLTSSIYYKKTVYELVTANGLSSSKLICHFNGDENKNDSRRVEFKLLTNSCQKAGVYDKSEAPINYCLQESNLD